MTTWYGSLQNRLMENTQFDGEIKVGTGVTELMYSDRHPYEVISVKDQKHITIRELDHKLIGKAYSNDWELISNEDNPTYELVKRGKSWYFKATWTAEEVDRLTDERDKVFLIINGWDLDKIKEKGQQTKYRKANVVIGFADYYYDYEF